MSRRSDDPPLKQIRKQPSSRPRQAHWYQQPRTSILRPAGSWPPFAEQNAGAAEAQTSNLARMNGDENVSGARRIELSFFSGEMDIAFGGLQKKERLLLFPEAAVSMHWLSIQ